MIYLKKFTSQDLRTGGGGSNTLIASKVITAGFFPAPLRPPGIRIKIYHGNTNTDLEYGYSGTVTTNTEVRLKSFSSVMTAEGAAVGDIGIFKAHPGEANAYDVTFVSQTDPDFSFYNGILSGNHTVVDVITDDDDDSVTASLIAKPYNWLIYGAPGTGKSNLLRSESAAFGGNTLRVTFYPDYSYAKFVGSYKPATYYKNTGGSTTYHTSRTDSAPADSITNEPVIDYRFIPGPFLTMLMKAWKDPGGEQNFLLIIEELNRAAAAAVFGEVFQLLDRKNGRSEYRVRLSDEAMNWTQEELAGETFDDIRNDIMQNGIFIPSNFFIWATMNSADQGVFPLDSAFKRRWQVQYLPLDANEDKLDGITLNFGGIEYNWNNLRKALNIYLSEMANVAEDRLIAPFFLLPEDFADQETARIIFKNKLLLYLKDDVLRHKKGFFNNMNQTISAIDRNFGAKNNPAESWDFFSVLTQGEAGAADYIKGVYVALNGVAASTPGDDSGTTEAVPAT